MLIEVGGGPVGGPTSKDGAGFTGTDATRYSGSVGGAQSEVLSTIGTTLADTDRLRYAIYPELDPELSYAATYVAIDLRFTDGTLLSELGLTDQYGMGFSAAGQGTAKILYCDQWNDVQVDLGPAAGRTVEAILLTVDAPETLAGLPFTGWVDAVEIAPAPPEPDGSDRCAYVDTRRGTNASHGFSRGNNLPITAWPNGFNFLTPVTDATTHRWPYEYHRANNADNRPELQGLAFSHQPSPWMGDRDQLIIMPGSSSEPQGDPVERAVAFDHADELARPDRYRVQLADGVLAELTPSDHGAVFRFAFPAEAAGRHVIIDTIDEHGAFRLQGRELTGWVENGSPFGRTRMYCCGRFDVDPTHFGATAGGRGNTRAATFVGVDTVELRIATSFIGTEQARRNLDLELGDQPFEEIQERANQAWNERFSVLTVEPASEPQLRTLYGSLYRLNLYPNSQFENTGTIDEPDHRYASPVLPTVGEPDDQHTNAVIKSGKMYVNNGFWDTYRTAWPAYAFFYPTLAAELVDGFVQQYRDGGWIARWSSPGYADLMTGTSSDVAFGDAYAKGVPLPDPLATYDAGLRNATVTPDDPAVGRKGLATGIFTGYVSTDTEESVSWALEGYLNDFGLAVMAARLADDPTTPEDRRTTLREEAEYFRRRSRNYQLLFDPKINFFQGRRPDGTFAQSPADFDPCAWGGDFTETDGWNFAFHVAHDGNGLAALYGGRDGLEAKLDEFFSTPELADKKGTYGSVIHEMTEARAVRMGQFGFSNQPAHHIPFIYNYTDAPAKAQRIVREVQRRLFVGEQIGQGYPGDEDNGEMSAWYLFSVLGLYPLRVGSDDYAVTAPLFERADVKPIGGRPMTIVADGQGPENPYVQGMSIDGAEHSIASISAAELAGSTVTFRLGAEPSDWGSHTAPPAITEQDQQPAPLRDLVLAAEIDVDPDLRFLFDDDAETEVDLGSSQPVVEWSLPEPVAADFYTLTSAVGGQPPSEWRLEGSTDGAGWELLDERSDQVFRWTRQTRPFKINNPAPYAHYRLSMTATDGAVSLAEVELLR